MWISCFVLALSGCALEPVQEKGVVFRIDAAFVRQGNSNVDLAQLWGRSNEEIRDRDEELVIPGGLVQDYPTITDAENLLSAAKKLAPEARLSMLYGATFAGYSPRGERLYRFDEADLAAFPGEGPDANSTRLRSFLASRLGADPANEEAIRFEPFRGAFHPASSLIVEIGEAGAALEFVPGEQVEWNEDRERSELNLLRVVSATKLGETGERWVTLQMPPKPMGPRFDAGPPPYPSDHEMVLLALRGDVRSVGSDHNYRQPIGRSGSFRPDDPHFFRSSQWALWAIRAPAAWNTVHASPVKVAIADTGIEKSHPDLLHNLIKNVASEVVGKDLVQTAGAPPDFHDLSGHGTFMAGIIGASGNNRLGMTGLCWRVRLLPIRVAAGETAVNVKTTMEQAVRYALEQKAEILSLSYIAFDSDEKLKKAFKDAEVAGMLIVASSGNAGEITAFPAAYPFDNILSVMGVDTGYEPYERSQMEKSDVDLAAPAQCVYGTELGGGFGGADGVSVATALVSGAAALVLGHPCYAKLTPSEVRELLMKHARKLDSLALLCESGGVLDLSFLGGPIACSSTPPVEVWESLTGVVEAPQGVTGNARFTVTVGAKTFSLETCGDQSLDGLLRELDGEEVVLRGVELTKDFFEVVYVEKSQP